MYRFIKSVSKHDSSQIFNCIVDNQLQRLFTLLVGYDTNPNRGRVERMNTNAGDYLERFTKRENGKTKTYYLKINKGKGTADLYAVEPNQEKPPYG